MAVLSTRFTDKLFLIFCCNYGRLFIMHPMSKITKIGKIEIEALTEIPADDMQRVVQMFTELLSLDDSGGKSGRMQISYDGSTYTVRSPAEHDGELDDGEYNGFVGLAGMFQEHCFQGKKTIVERIDADGNTMETYDSSMEMRV